MNLLKLFGLGRRQQNAVSRIGVEEAHELVTAGRLMLIDVRHPQEWNETGRPAGSYGVTLQDREFELKVLEILGDDKSKPVALSCRTGARSSRGADRLVAAGHMNVSNIEGGFLAWKKAGLPIDAGPF